MHPPCTVSSRTESETTIVCCFVYLPVAVSAGSVNPFSHVPTLSHTSHTPTQYLTPFHAFPCPPHVQERPSSMAHHSTGSPRFITSDRGYARARSLGRTFEAEAHPQALSPTTESAGGARPRTSHPSGGSVARQSRPRHQTFPPSGAAKARAVGDSSPGAWARARAGGPSQQPHQPHTRRPTWGTELSELGHGGTGAGGVAEVSVHGSGVQLP